MCHRKVISITIFNHNMRISKHFKLHCSQAELDFVDIDINRDLPLFVDPHFLAARSDPWSISAAHTIQSFFGYFLGLLNQGSKEEARDLFDHLHEPNETCLGMSRGRPRGNGVGDEDAGRIFESLSQSRAAKTGLLEDIEDCRVFVRGIDKDKTSDMTTNIIRGHLIKYTQHQCELWGIPLIQNSPSGFCWNAISRSWENGYSKNLYIGGRRILLVPKAVVSYSKAYTPQRYHRHFVLSFLQNEHLRLHTALVRSRRRKDGSIYEYVTKKDLIEKGNAAFDKDFLAAFTKAHPRVFDKFKEFSKKDGASIPIEDLVENDVTQIALYLQERLKAISRGQENATDYHRTVVGIMDFLFYPHLINPLIEREIHEGRKRIDITFDNAAEDGFFRRLHEISKITCPFIFVECKNYSRDVANPELDQIAGRFAANRGQFGLVVCRTIENQDIFLARCRDTFRDGRGLILPLTDSDLLEGLRTRAEGAKDPLDNRLAELYRAVALA
jgi:hypothetical protein